ncbi:hypothetical protein DFP72DRAFT_1125024 [Ephemerocybe angulata]|uniref:Uncharacterized protein n=1 Tax=Ephemerocybe angulata TaxID=980116 RepID=A0A8H6M4J6_9AGAR|nr:hypothetical protein DFP72DRAFT_1125024 [Tulosesus angulatus]
MSPDPTQVNTVINSYSPPDGGSDPYAAIRLEDRCRHLEKTVKELQSRLRSKELEVKNREGEVRAKDVELRAKDAEVRQKDGEMREKENEARKREGDLRDREGELREVEGLLREMEGEVRWRDEEIERLKARDLQWQRAVQKMDAERKAERELANRKSMKELVNQTKENAEKLERELKRRASAAPVMGSREFRVRTKRKMSTSAPSAAHLANGYQASKRQKQEPSESGSSVSSSAATTETEESNEHSPSTSPSASPASPPQQPQARPVKATRTLSNAAPTSFLRAQTAGAELRFFRPVNDINSEVVQFAAVVTEMCRFAPREVPSPSPSPTPYSVPGGSGSRSRAQDNNGDMNQLKGTKPYADTAARLGGALTHLLATYDHSNDPILVQLALQACVCIAAKRAWESFCLGLPAKSDGVLGAIYRSLRELEPQPTSSKWRSLTHGHIHAIYPSLAAYSANELGETMLRWTLDILTLAGCVGIESSASTPTNANPPPNPGSLASYGLTVNTNPPSANVLRQDILSTTFDLVIPECGMSFGKEWMVDFFGFTAKEAPNGGGNSHSDRREDNKVLGSVEVGLMCRTRVGMRGGGSTPTVANGGGMGSILGGQGTNMSQQQQGGTSGAVYEERLLLMPKVILESMVDLL